MVDLEVETCDGVSGAKKRFLGVSKVGNRWVARVRNRMLRVDVRLGSYRTPEEAALAVQKKKAEFEEMLKGEDLSSMGTYKGYFKGMKLPSGVSWDNGRYRVQIRHPKLKKLVSGGSYKTCEEAADAADRKREEFRKMYGGTLRVIPDNEVFKKAEFDAKLKKPEFDCVEFRPGSEATETPMKIERKFWYGCRPTSLLDAHNLENFALCDKSSYDCDKVDIPAKLGDGLVEMSPPSDFDPKNLNNARAPGSDTSCDSDFDRAVSLGIINEYGQLLGEYSELDKHMGIKLA
ncbi:uncharacterized protein LOC141598931 [Silene latifolia]|uniref:uncharacterized protein LOC141598931 n=1 Tax=Silene latifolia TaxID=37657 RepID=UPI003D781AE7